jgi:hypothetical protein
MTELWTTAGIEWADRLAALVGDLKQHNPSLWAHVSQERNERFPLRGWASLSRDGTPTEDVAISLDFERVPGGVKYQADIAHGDGLILAETPAQWRAVGNRGDTRPFSQMTSASGSTQAAGVGEDFMIGVTVARLKGDLPHGPAAFLNEDLVDASPRSAIPSRWIAYATPCAGIHPGTSSASSLARRSGRSVRSAPPRRWRSSARLPATRARSRARRRSTSYDARRADPGPPCRLRVGIRTSRDTLTGLPPAFRDGASAVRRRRHLHDLQLAVLREVAAADDERHR